MVNAKRLPMAKGFGKTERIDAWWKSPLAMSLYLGAAIIYATWRGFMEADFWIFESLLFKNPKVIHYHSEILSSRRSPNNVSLDHYHSKKS